MESTKFLTKSFYKKKEFWIPLLLLIAFTPSSHSGRPLYQQPLYRQHSFSSDRVYSFIYHYGILPAWILAGVSTIGLLISITFSRYRKYLKICSYLCLTLLIGSGVIVHLVLKDHWGRPRPKQTIEYGGEQSYRAYYNFHFDEPSRTFQIVSLRTLYDGFLLFLFDLSRQRAE